MKTQSIEHQIAQDVESEIQGLVTKLTNKINGDLERNAYIMRSISLLQEEIHFLQTTF